MASIGVGRRASCGSIARDISSGSQDGNVGSGPNRPIARRMSSWIYRFPAGGWAGGNERTTWQAAGQDGSGQDESETSFKLG